jgi:hypothetical protein
MTLNKGNIITFLKAGIGTKALSPKGDRWRIHKRSSKYVEGYGSVRITITLKKTPLGSKKEQKHGLKIQIVDPRSDESENVISRLLLLGDIDNACKMFGITDYNLDDFIPELGELIFVYI